MTRKFKNYAGFLLIYLIRWTNLWNFIICVLIYLLPEQDEESEDEDDGSHDVQDDENDAILEEDEDELDGSGNESGSECSEYDRHRKPEAEPKFICQECQQNAVQNQKDNLMTKWLKNNYDPRYF